MTMKNRLVSIDLAEDNVGYTENVSLKPPLKWAGGKRWLAPDIYNYWLPHISKRFVEPFCGGLSVSLSLLPRNALLNDANPHLINFYGWLQKGLSITINAKNLEEVYYDNRDRFNELIQRGFVKSNEAAQLFYYLNRTCFNGLCRFNQKGGFNVPFGTYADTLKYADGFQQYRAVFKQWTFTSTDFEALRLEPTDFVYADPPYDVEFTAYSKGGFSWDDQERTAKWLVKHPGPVILSNQKTKKIMELYQDLGFKIIVRDAPRRISCTGDRRAVKEVLALRNLDFVSMRS
jgi:DNA adenine methylase